MSAHHLGGLTRLDEGLQLLHAALVAGTPGLVGRGVEVGRLDGLEGVEDLTAGHLQLGANGLDLVLGGLALLSPREEALAFVEGSLADEDPGALDQGRRRVSVLHLHGPLREPLRLLDVATGVEEDGGQHDHVARVVLVYRQRGADGLLGLGEQLTLVVLIGHGAGVEQQGAAREVVRPGGLEAQCLVQHLGGLVEVVDSDVDVDLAQLAVGGRHHGLDLQRALQGVAGVDEAVLVEEQGGHAAVEAPVVREGLGAALQGVEGLAASGSLEVPGALGVEHLRGGPELDRPGVGRGDGVLAGPLGLLELGIDEVQLGVDGIDLQRLGQAHPGDVVAGLLAPHDPADLFDDRVAVGVGQAGPRAGAP